MSYIQYLLHLNTVVPNKNGQERPSGLGQYCQENACENFYGNPSNMMEVSPRCKEEQEAATTG